MRSQKYNTGSKHTDLLRMTEKTAATFTVPISTSDGIEAGLTGPSGSGVGLRAGIFHQRKRESSGFSPSGQPGFVLNPRPLGKCRL